jgi:mono/diheme cytochrome c family protein
MKTLTLKTLHYVGLPGATIITFCATIAWLVIGYPTNNQAGTVAAANPSPEAGGKSGAQLWAENCVRCHNIRSPSSYSPAQWEVVMMHMRVRANLTPEEHKKILEFLKAGT